MIFCLFSLNTQTDPGINVPELVVLIDLKKAFDTVDHQILLNKLELYGIKGQALTLLKSYITNRNQKCQIKNSFYLHERLIKCGVPQGSLY
jgi:hypothetical protein